MKIEFDDSEYGTGITLTPETLEEASLLMRLAANTKKETPEIYLSYYDKIFCSIWMKKRKDKITSIKN
jgi:hypothetical protein